MSDTMYMQDLTPFEIDLDKFQFEIMEEWFHRTHQEIGISIQKLEDIQDASNPTRIRHAAGKRINFYCKKIQEKAGNLEKCDGLDTSLKAIANKPGFSQLNYACRCHAGVSNILIPYRHPKDKHRVWFVFIGQFLLKQETSATVNRYLNKVFRTQHLSVLETRHISSDHAQYVQPGVFIPESDCSAFGADQGHISCISATELLTFREFLLTAFSRFLDDYYATEEGHKKIVDWGKEVRPRQRLLKQITESQRWLAQLPQPPPFTGDLAKMLGSIYGYVSSAGMSQDDVLAVERWLNDGKTNGRFQSRQWMEEGKQLTRRFCDDSQVRPVKEGGEIVQWWRRIWNWLLRR